MSRSYVAFDLETTGLRPACDRILEIGAVRIENGQATGTYETLVCHSLPIPASITELTGITDEMTADAPDLKTAVEGFLAFAQDSVLLGHNVNFDYRFMKQNVVRLGGKFERSGLDTLAIARVCLPMVQGKSLDRLAAWYGIGQQHHHRALDDARTAAGIYERMREEFAQKMPSLFVPAPLQYKVCKDSPITNSQKVYLRDLIKYHRIDCDVKIDQLTKSEASRMIDRILLQHGKIAR